MTASHVIGFCSRFKEARQWLVDLQSGRMDIKSLVGTPKGALQTSQVVHTAAHPPTVYLAKELLYGEDNEAQVNWAAGQLPS